MKLKATVLFLLILAIGCKTEDPETNPIPQAETVLGCTDPMASNFSSDANEDDCDCQYDGFTAIGNAPSSVTKNILIEEFTGEWCGWCVDATSIIDEIKQEHGDRVFVNAMHQGDFLENRDATELRGLFSVSGYPSGLVNRKTGAVVPRELWISMSDDILEESAKVGIALETKVTGAILDGVVHVDFNEDLSGSDYLLHIYLLENGIPAVAQENYYSSLYGTHGQGHPYYDRPARLGPDEYIHDHVLRRILIKNQKIAPKAIRGEGIFTRKFSIAIADFVRENVEVIAFVSKNTGLQLLNVAGANAGETSNWK